jgi:hypothetical protein
VDQRTSAILFTYLRISILKHQIEQKCTFMSEYALISTILHV